MDISSLSPVYWALLILGASSVFAALWFLDALTHKKIVQDEISVPELQTHRNILVASVLMECSLILMYWMPLAALPLFIAFWITRTAHEFIDELKYHSDRCSAYENYLHLGMWVSVIAKTGAMFIWGFFFQFDGVFDLHPGLFVWAALLLLLMSWISWKEWGRSK